jgi:hypothetical protein
VRCFFAAAVALLTVLAPTRDLAQDFVARARAEHKLALEMEGCPAVPACLAMLDAVVAPVDDGGLNEAARKISTNLQRFGEPAKQELLRRAAGAHPGWRNLAGGILQFWGSWSPSDVAAIRAALQLQHGGWIARSLVAIKTPEAIQALVEDLAFAGAATQTGFALTQIGPDALPYLFRCSKTTITLLLQPMSFIRSGGKRRRRRPAGPRLPQAQTVRKTCGWQPFADLPQWGTVPSKRVKACVKCSRIPTWPSAIRHSRRWSPFGIPRSSRTLPRIAIHPGRRSTESLCNPFSAC